MILPKLCLVVLHIAYIQLAIILNTKRGIVSLSSHLPAAVMITIVGTATGEKVWGICIIFHGRNYDELAAAAFNMVTMKEPTTMMVVSKWRPSILGQATAPVVVSWLW